MQNKIKEIYKGHFFCLFCSSVMVSNHEYFQNVYWNMNGCWLWIPSRWSLSFMVSFRWCHLVVHRLAPGQPHFSCNTSPTWPECVFHKCICGEWQCGAGSRTWKKRGVLGAGEQVTNFLSSQGRWQHTGDSTLCLTTKTFGIKGYLGPVEDKASGLVNNMPLWLSLGSWLSIQHVYITSMV